MRADAETRTKRIREAFNALMKDGEKPTAKDVIERMRKKHGAGASMRDVVPVLRVLLAEARGSSRAVDSALAVFRQLNPVEREMFLDRIRSGL
jgi:hypothetical protein